MFKKFAISGIVAVALACGFSGTASALPVETVDVYTSHVIVAAKLPGGPVTEAPNGEMLGASGVRTISSTMGESTRNLKVYWRIDVENPAPGKRPGQMHIQDKKGGKWLYNFNSRVFENAPKHFMKIAMNDRNYTRAVQKGGAFLGVG